MRPASSKKEDENSKEGEGGAFLSYDVYLGLAVLGGFFALDHLYLRSPLTFLAKLIINILFLGVWWLYDASQAFFNGDVIKVFGLSIPGIGPKGIGAGMLASKVPDKKHMNFFIYSLALLLGGLFGLDSFIVGDKKSGFIRLITLITGLLAPIAIAWWFYNLFKFFFKTKDVTTENWEYFGAPMPAEYTMPLGDKLVKRFPFLETIFGPIKAAKNIAEAVIQRPEEIIEGPIRRALLVAKPVVNEIIGPVVQPVTNTVKLGLTTIDDVASTAREGIALAKNTLNTGAKIATNAIETAGETAKGLTAAAGLAANAATLSSGFTENAARQALTNIQQQGGSEQSNTLTYVLIGTLAIITVSGLIVTYQRSKKNVKARDDSPPEPRNVREIGNEKPA